LLQGYDYEFFAPQPDQQKPMMIAASPQKPQDPVTAVVDVPNNQWTLLVGPCQGAREPTWRTPMLATVIVLSFVIGGLVLATLVSRHLQLWLLQATKVRGFFCLGKRCIFHRNRHAAVSGAHSFARLCNRAVIGACTRGSALLCSVSSRAVMITTRDV
jgi:hypothetical protein